MLSKILSELKGFKNPKIILEQYPTDSEIAARLINFVILNNHQNLVFADLGAGTGILGIGALISGAKKVYFIEKDNEVIEILKENIHFIEKKYKINMNYEIINDDVVNFYKKVDVVLMNPPFGTKKRHADVVFYDVAFRISKFIYTITKKTTKEFIIHYALKNNFKSKILFDCKHLLKQTYKFHKSRTKFIDVTGLLLFRSL